MPADLEQYLTPVEDYFANLSIGLTTLIEVTVIMALGFLANRGSNILIERAIKRRGGDEHSAKTAKRLSAYLIYSFALILVLGALGVPPSALGTIVGLIGLGLSFALRDIIANFISGVLIMINRPFKIGDQIKVGGEEGTIRDIQIRASEIKTYDGRKLIVPNSDLYNKTVINNTAYDQRRFEVIVGIGYDEDIKAAKEAAQDVLEEAEGVEAEPEPQVLVDALDDSSVNLKLRGWTRPSRANMVKAGSDVSQKVKERYDEEGIDIPFPIRTVYMDSDEE